jgi:hypothetical protein
MDEKDVLPSVHTIGRRKRMRKGDNQSSLSLEKLIPSLFAPRTPGEVSVTKSSNHETTDILAVIMETNNVPPK